MEDIVERWKNNILPAQRCAIIKDMIDFLYSCDELSDREPILTAEAVITRIRSSSIMFELKIGFNYDDRQLKYALAEYCKDYLVGYLVHKNLSIYRIKNTETNELWLMTSDEYHKL